MAEQYHGRFEEVLQLQFDKLSEKLKPSYGLRLSKSFWSNVSVAYNSYYQIRNSNWNTNEKYAQGKITHTEFLDLLGIEGNQSYVNLDYTISKILPKYEESLVSGFMDRDEEPSVKATDILSQQFKEREKVEAKYRLRNKDVIPQLEQMSGQKLEKGFMPNNEDEIDIYFKTKYRTPEEMFIQKTIKQIFKNNNLDGDFKRQILSDEIEKNFMAAKIETVNSHSKTFANRIKIRRCKPARCFYNIFESPIGDDISFFGEAYPLTIAEARRQYPKVTEKQWFLIAEKSQKGLKQAEPLTWYDSYVYSYTRPYDDYSFMVLDYEVKSIDKNHYVKTENQYGNTVVVQKKGKPNPLGNQEMKGEAIEDERFNIYCGIWAIDTEIMLDWDIQENMIRPYQNGVDVFFSYTVVIPNNDGTYQPSLIERGISNVRAMALYKLKIAQMVSLMEADGVLIDVGGLNKVTLGQGATYEPLTLMKIKSQTGRVYWDSTDTTGTGLEGQRTPPIQNFPNSGNVAQINTLIQLYNFELQNLNDEFGVNNDFIGGSVPAKRGAKVSENQIQAANKATEYLYTHYLWFVSMIATKITYKLWDILVFEATDFKEMQGFSSDVIDTTFDTNVEMSSKSENKAKLEEMISIALQEKIISLSQAMVLREYDDVKEAIIYIENAEKKAQQQAIAQKQNDIQQNAQVQQQSLMMKAQADAYLEKAKAEREANTEKSKGDAKSYEQLINMVKEVTLKSMENNTPIPAQISDLMKTLQGNVIQQSVIKPAQKEESEKEQQMAQQQQQAQQNQQQS
jgi:hypothetical protein